MAVFLTFLLSVVIWITQVWLAMLALGAAHSFDGRIPALGFFAVAWLGFAIRVIVINFNVEAKK